MHDSLHLQSALERLDRLLLEAPVFEAVLARRESGRADPDDLAICEDLADVVIAHQSTDGSWAESVIRSAEALLLLADFRAGDEQTTAAITEGVGWLRTRQNLPGHFGDPCEPDLHTHRLCHHHAGGFITPSPQDLDPAEQILSSGLRIRGKRDVSLTASALALHAIARTAQRSTEDMLQGLALRRIAEIAFRPRITGPLDTPAVLIALGTLARMPRTAEVTVALHGAVSRLVDTQRPDGSWPGVESVHVLELLLAAIANGYASPMFDAAILRTVERLPPDESDPHRMLICWRALRYAMKVRG